MRDVRKPVLLEEMSRFYSLLNRWHKQGIGELNQIIQRRERQSDNLHSIVFCVEPLGVQIRYSRQVVQGGAAEGEGVRVVKETVVFNGSHSQEKMVNNEFRISEITGDLLEPDRDIACSYGDSSGDSDDLSALMLRYYLEVCFDQTAGSMERSGVISHPAEIITGVKGVRRKLNLAHVEEFNDPGGEPYTRTTFEDIVIPAITDVYYKISFVGYDRLFILERGILLDCGDCSVLEDIVGGAKDSGKNLDFGMSEEGVSQESASQEGVSQERVREEEVFRDGAGISDVDHGEREQVKFMDIDSYFRFRESYYANRGRMSVYEHENDFIYLFEGLFPDSGSVYIYTQDREIVNRLFNYAFQRRAKEHTRVDGGWLVFDDKGLRISFLGDKAESEFERLTESMYEAKLPNLRKGRIVSDILD